MESSEPTVLETCRVSPPPGSVTPSPILLPLTYYDVLCSGLKPVKRLFLYSFPCSTADFLDTHVPNLKRTLSLALQHFYPLAGAIVESGDKISYAEGESVPLTVAESHDDFVDLVGNHAKEDRRFHKLVAELPPKCGEKEPLLALQVTVFPGRGIGVGLTNHHAVVDGFSSTRFMEAWASFARTADKENVCLALPLIDRSGYVIPDDEKLLEKVMRTKNAISSVFGVGSRINRTRLNTSGEAMARATFVLTVADLECLRKWVDGKTGIRCSDFAVAIALVWVCLMKENSGADENEETETETEVFDGYGFLSDSRGRAGSKCAIPRNYFGNCLQPCLAKLRRSELLGEGGVAKAAAAIRDEIQLLKSASEPMEKDLAGGLSGLDTLQTVAGSPRLGVYKVDFGWGKPRKVEVVSTEEMCGISLAENEADDGGGIQVGVVLPFSKMRRFAVIFQRQRETCTED